MIDLPPFKEFSANLWDYLSDMTSYMPSYNDRREIEKRAANAGHRHRVRIWDYFFTPQRKDVGKPIQDEIAELRTLAAKKEAEAQQARAESVGALVRLEQIRRKELAGVEAELLAIENTTAAQERTSARARIISGAVIGGAGLLCGFVVFVMVIAASVQNDAFAEAGATCVAFFGFLVGAPLLVLGGCLAFLGMSRIKPEKIQILVAGQQKRVRDAWARRESVFLRNLDSERARANDANEILEQLVPHLRSHIEQHERTLQGLLAQLPPVPSADEVEKWFAADIDYLVERAEEQLGIEGRLLKLDTRNPFMIRGPAEIQEEKLIPLTYRRGDPDREKYLHARRFGKTANGRDVQHYGVFHLEQLFITGPVLARYSVFFDFIRGEVMGERAPQQHFVDFVRLEMRREFREIPIDGNKVVLDRAPSMILALSNGDRISITVPNTEYFDALKVESTNSEYDAYAAAETALRAITEQVNTAKRNLEISQLARMKEAEKDS